jgi:hypothetical protein
MSTGLVNKQKGERGRERSNGVPIKIKPTAHDGKSPNEAILMVRDTQTGI